jgi:hypothetical protein
VNGNDRHIARLRGALAQEEPGARGLERVARNPECLRLRALTIAGITPGTAATAVMGLEDREAQSPFAMTIDQRFERHLLSNGAANLFALYVKEGRLGPTDSKVSVISDFAPGDTQAARQRREAETRRLFDLKLRGDPTAPNLVVRPRLTVPLVGVPHAFEPDFLVASDADPFFRVGDLKSYPDRGGKTDQADLRSACRQSAVGVVGLRHATVLLGVQDPSRLAIAQGDLILKVTGLFLATLRPMTLTGEVDSILRALADAPSNLAELEGLLPAGGALDDPQVLAAIPNHYRSTCREHCALWTHCRSQAQVMSNPVILGDEASERLAAAGSLNRARDLMNGVGLPPRNPAEAALAAELLAANQIYRRVVGGE